MENEVSTAEPAKQFTLELRAKAVRLAQASGAHDRWSRSSAGLSYPPCAIEETHPIFLVGGHGRRFGAAAARERGASPNDPPSFSRTLV